MTIIEALTWANNALETETPMLDAQVLLSAVINKSKTWLFTHGSDPLTPSQEETFQKLIARRATHEPIAYLLGTKPFYGRHFIVTPDTLIPRPDTELMIDAALAMAKDSPTTVIFADIGTGSGAIAVTLAKETTSVVIATDVSADALVVAKKNATTHSVADRIHFREGNLLLPITEDPPIKSAKLIICANLPYLSESQWEGLMPDVKQFEPKLALTAGADGLDLYRILLLQLKQYRHKLPNDVTILMEIDPSQSTMLPKLIQKDFPDSTPTIKQDLSGKDRLVLVSL